MEKKNTKERNGSILTWEHEDKYFIKVDKNKNRLYAFFTGKWKKANDIPNFVEHMQQAANEVSEGYQLFASSTKFQGNPGFGCTTPMVKAQKLLLSKKPSKHAAACTSLGHKMVLGVLGKLTHLTQKVFSDDEAAIAWLDEDE